MSAPAVGAVFPKINPHANYVGSCQQSVKRQPCSLQSIAWCVWCLHRMLHQHIVTNRLGVCLPCVFRPDSPAGLKTPHPLFATPSLEATAAQGKPCPPCAGNWRKMEIRKAQCPFETTKPSLSAQKRFINRRMCRLSSAPTHSRSSSRTHDCPSLCICRSSCQTDQISHWGLSVCVWWILTVLYDTVTTTLVQDPLRVGRRSKRVIFRLQGDKQTLLQDVLVFF